MKIKNLINKLQQLNPEKEIASWDFENDTLDCELIQIFDFSDILDFDEFENSHEDFEIEYFLKNKPDYIINIGNQE